MPDVSIRINGRNFDISCDPGEESRILDLAGYIDSKISSLTGLGGAYNDSHLHVLSLLMITDELFDAREGVVPTAKAVEGVDTSDLEKELRVKVEAEYAEQLAALQERVMAQDEVIETLRAKADIGGEAQEEPPCC